MAGGSKANVGDARNEDENAISFNFRLKISTDIR
jgi:hypothetical protein